MNNQNVKQQFCNKKAAEDPAAREILIKDDQKDEDEVNRLLAGVATPMHSGPL